MEGWLVDMDGELDLRPVKGSEQSNLPHMQPL